MGVSMLDVNDAVFQTPTPDTLPSYKLCGIHAITRKRCIGCGKTVKASLVRCHNKYLCDNCGSDRVLLHLWIRSRDPMKLKAQAQTGVELCLPVDHSMSLWDREQAIRNLRQQLTDELGVDELYMPVVDPESCRIRVMLAGSFTYNDLSARWRRITKGQGWLHIRHYSPDESLESFVSIYCWTFDGLRPLRSLTESQRLQIQEQFAYSRRISSRGKFYASLSKEELHVLREQQALARHSDDCPCCGSPVLPIAFGEMLLGTIDELAKRLPDCSIIYGEDYDVFWQSRREKAYKVASRSSLYDDLRKWPSLGHAPPN
jgi:hypothetical protein